MIYVAMGAFGLSFLALLWMAKLLGDAGAYKQAFLVIFLGTLGWCMPMFIQVFVLATFVTICVQWWEDTKPAFIAWAIAVAALVAIGQLGGGTNAMIKGLNPADAPADVATPVESPSAQTP